MDLIRNITIDEIEGLVGGRFGIHDVPCPISAVPPALKASRMAWLVATFSRATGCQQTAGRLSTIRPATLRRSSASTLCRWHVRRGPNNKA
jgi:hypothetical protein